jgi:hypothetical protein
LLFVVNAASPIKARAHEERAGRSEHERVAIGGRFGDGLRADRSAGTAAVLDHDLLSEALGQGLGEQAARQVGVAARRKRHNESNRSVRKAGLGEAAGRGQANQ